MAFHSIDFLIFFPVVTLIYFAVPGKLKNIWLLAASYYFYMSWNPGYALLIAFSTFVTWAGALFIGKDSADTEPSRSQRKRKACLAACLCANLLILGFFKYYGFLAGNLNALIAKTGVSLKAPAFDLLLPVGISFYTFQALGYLLDVYRGETAPEKNLWRYALFVSFFPQLVAGPIERSGNLLRQFREEHRFDGNRVVRGLLLMGWGFFKKLVIADRAALLVNEVYGNYTGYFGLQIAAATVFFGMQIYCDFSGYSEKSQ